MTCVLPLINFGSIDDCVLPATIQLREYWQILFSPSGELPRYQNTNLMDIYKISAILIVKDVINDGEDFINRYWGSELRNTIGRELTGVRISEYTPQREASG